jgi:hypothetical protein
LLAWKKAMSAPNVQIVVARVAAETEEDATVTLAVAAAAVEVVIAVAVAVAVEVAAAEIAVADADNTRISTHKALRPAVSAGLFLFPRVAIY